MHRSRAQLPQSLRGARAVADERRELSGIGALVDAETGREALHVWQAGRQIAVIIENRLIMLQLNLGRDPNELIERDSKKDYGIDIRLRGQDSIEMPLPNWRY
jgi:hypothetical protein